MNRAKPKDIVIKRPLANVPKAPVYLSRFAKLEWKRVAPILVDRKTLTDGDLGALETYCVAVSRVRECERLLKKDGPVIDTAKGKQRHPAVGIQAQAATTVRHFAVELGLTPVSRSRPAIRDDDNADDLAGFDL